MSEAARSRYRTLIGGELERLGRKDQATLGATFAKLREANESLIARRAMPDLQAAELRRVLAEVIAEHEPAASAPAPESIAPQADAAEPAPPAVDAAGQPPRRSRAALVSAGFCGALIALAAVVGISTLHPQAATALQLGASSTEVAKPGLHLAGIEPRLQKAKAPMTAAVRFLRTLRKQVTQRQKEDPIGLTAVAGDALVPFERIDADYRARLPKSLSQGAEVWVRADVKGYKLLLRSPLCTDAKYTRPRLVDPKRDLKTAGCEYFGLWNKAGAAF